MITRILPQTDQPVKTNLGTQLVAIALGEYHAYRGGEFISKIYAASYPEALPQFHKLLDETRTEQPTPDWWTCDCGRVNDAETDDCPDCAELLAENAIFWITDSGRRFLEPVRPGQPADALEDGPVVVNGEWWLTADLPRPAPGETPWYVRRNEEAVT